MACAAGSPMLGIAAEDAVEEATFSKLLEASIFCLLAKAAGSEDLASFLGSQPPKPPQPPQPPSMAGGGNIGMSDGAEPPDSIPIFCMRVISNCCCI